MAVAYIYDGDHYKFTGKERDSESGLDNFGARYNASSLGRFMTPDPIAGIVANPQSLNRYAYVLNRPLVLTDPTGMIVDWNDSKKSKKDGKTHAERAFEKRLEQLKNSNKETDRVKGAALQKTYDRLQASKATFEVAKPDSTGDSRGDLQYDGNNHFTVNLKGDTAMGGFTDNQKLAHEFEHGRQVLDGELSFKLNSTTGNWDPFAHDVTDEANAFAAGFSIEGATPAKGPQLTGPPRLSKPGEFPVKQIISVVTSRVTAGFPSSSIFQIRRLLACIRCRNERSHQINHCQVTFTSNCCSCSERRSLWKSCIC